jgi:NAD(P) transhydrogenase
VSERFDFVVIGSGPAGQKAAICAAKAGKRALVIERARAVGGACVHHGTIPSKTLRETVLAVRGLARRSGGAMGRMAASSSTEIRGLMTRVERVIGAHEDYIATQLARNGVAVWHGQARFVSAHEIEVRAPSGSVSRAWGDHVVLAVGTRPRTPPGVDVDHEHVFDSDSILSMTYLPRSMVVLGGGVIACEYASIFAALGVEVTIVDSGARPMAFLDPELTSGFVDAFRAHGGRYLASCRAKSARHDGLAECEIVLDNPAGHERVTAEKILCALGRVANVDALALEAAGLATNDRGLIAVDDEGRTAVPHIYAAGDVIGPPALASAAMEQGRHAIRHALGLPSGTAASVSPIGVYTIPEIASVGLSESEALARFGGCVVGRAPYRELARAHIAALDDGFIKLVADPAGEKLVGVQVLGDGASELVHVGQMAIAGGLEIDALIETSFNFPTLAEGYRVAALDVVKRRP